MEEHNRRVEANLQWPKRWWPLAVAVAWVLAGWVLIFVAGRMLVAW